jgi:hypothetical protein
MNSDGVNPYEPPISSRAAPGQARFRLRRWFAVALYLALLVNFFTIWSFGLQPILISIYFFMLSFIASVAVRRYAKIQLHDTGIHYQDLVQVVSVSWDRVVRVIHRHSKAEITTTSPLAQITVSRAHGEYDSIVERLAEIQDRRRVGSVPTRHCRFELDIHSSRAPFTGCR